MAHRNDRWDGIRSQYQDRSPEVCRTAGSALTRGRRDSPALASKLAQWQCEDQAKLFSDDELLTSEIREWKDGTA